MQTNYEIAMNEFMPAFRAAAAGLLVKKYGASQQMAALLLEITQASVSKYLNGKYSDAVKGAGTSIDEVLVEEFVSEIVGDHERCAQKAMCRACQKYNSFDCAIMVKSVKI